MTAEFLSRFATQNRSSISSLVYELQSAGP